MTHNETTLRPTQTRNRRRFRSHMVNRGLRFRLVWDDILFAFGAAIAAILILYFLSNREIGDSLWSAHLSLRETKELLDKGVKVAGAVVFVAVLLFGLWSVIDAHRIAGPMHRLDRLLGEMSEGDLCHEIAFRKSDEFQEIAAGADKLVDTLNERITRMKGVAGRINDLVASGSLTQAQSEELGRLSSELKAELEFFKTGRAEIA